MRGDFDGALAEAEMALIDNSAERVKVLVRLADIALYLGDFSEAQRYGRSALDLASTSARQDWAAAEHHHCEALRLRREVADARGVLQSLHALGRARLGAGDRDEAER